MKTTATRSARIVGLVAAGVTTVVLAGATSAQAATLWHVDPTGDVQRTSDGRSAVSRTGWTDVVGVNASHTTDSLRVGSSIRGYRGLRGSWTVTIATSRGDAFRVSTTLDKDLAADDDVLLYRSSPESGEDAIVDCEGLRLSRTERGTTVTVPTTCLGAPWRVRIGVQTASSGPYGSDAAASYADSGFRDGRRPASEQGTGLSGWVERG